PIRQRSKLTAGATFTTIMGHARTHGVCTVNADEPPIFVGAHWHKICSSYAPATEHNQLRIGNSGAGQHQLSVPQLEFHSRSTFPATVRHLTEPFAAAISALMPICRHPHPANGKVDGWGVRFLGVSAGLFHFWNKIKVVNRWSLQCEKFLREGKYPT